MVLKLAPGLKRAALNSARVSPKGVARPMPVMTSSCGVRWGVEILGGRTGRTVEATCRSSRPASVQRKPATRQDMSGFANTLR